MAPFDKDGDGRISPAEYGKPTNNQAPFSAADSNQDGAIDGDEWRDLIIRQVPRFQRDLKKARKKPPSGNLSREELKKLRRRAKQGKRPQRGERELVGRSSEDGDKVRGLLERRPTTVSHEGPLNILIVGMDTVRADRTTPYGHSRNTTPHLAAFAKRGVVFEQSIANSNESLYAHTNLWTARYASEAAKPVYETFLIPETATTFAEVLKSYGYATGGFVAGGHLDADFGHAQGFDTYEAQVGFGSFWSTVPQALEWIDGRSQEAPWMAFVHGYDAHSPYRTAAPFGHLFYDGPSPHPTDVLMADPLLAERIFQRTFYPGPPLFFDHPKGFRILSTETYLQVASRPTGESQPFDDGDIQHLRDHYDGCLAYADLHIGLLLAGLEDRGLLEHTVVLIVGDHGEDLLDHDFVNHRTGLYDSIIRVPMIAVGPGFPAGTRVETMVEALDLLPTVLRVAGAQVPVGSRGRALQDVVAGTAPPLEVVFSEGVMDMLSVRTETHKLVARGFKLIAPDLIPSLASVKMESARFDLYDLKADPDEQQDLLRSATAENLALAEKLRSQMVKWRVDLAIGTATMDPSRVDPKVAEQLRIHGYWRSAEGG